MLKIVTDRDDLAATLDDLVAEGARRMLLAALDAEVAEHIERHRQFVDKAGRCLVVRNGKAAERALMTASGALKVRAPRVDDRKEGCRFSSYILPRYARKSPKVADVLPVLYLRGLSTGDFAPALAEFFGTDAGLSASTISRLVETWTDEYAAFESRDLSGSGYVICVGRRDPFPDPSRGGPAALPGRRGGESRWQQRTPRLFRRVPRIGRVVGRGAARLAGLGHGRSGGRPSGSRSQSFRSTRNAGSSVSNA